jgi:UDP-3-O-[3-hydroxymyristoyl] glucosamine N-acyltransferase
MKTSTAAEIAALVQGRLVGDGGVTVHSVASLQEASPGHISFLGNALYRDQVLPSKAGIVFLPENFEEPPPAGRAWILCGNPSDAFSTMVEFFAPPPLEYPPMRHPTAYIHETAVIAPSAYIGPNAVVEAKAVIGEHSVVGAGSFIGQETVLGEHCLIYPNVTIRERCLLGNLVIIHSGTTIGSDGFGFIPGPNGHKKIPQVGIVQIDDDVEIGSQVAVDRARFGRTWIKRGAKIDNLVQIAHNVVIGEFCFIVAQVGISGSTALGRGVIAAGQAGIAGHLHIGDGAVLLGRAGVTKDIEAGANVMGMPAVDKRVFARSQLAVQQLPKLRQTVKQLQQELAALKKQLDL